MATIRTDCGKRSRVVAAWFFATFFAGCAGGPGTAAVPIVRPDSAAASAGQTLYAYSPEGHAGLVAFKAGLAGPSTPLSALGGKKTRLYGGKINVFGGGVRIMPDGSIYILDGKRGKLFVYAPGATGDTAPIRVASLPENSNKALDIPQYMGFALDNGGGFWTVDRSTGAMDRFLLSSHGQVSPTAALHPEMATPKGVQKANASTVTDDGAGNVYCLCQNYNLLLELYGVTTYSTDASGKLTVKSSLYGAPGDLHSQFPSDILYVDPVERQIYMGITGPNFVISFPTSTSGQLTKARILGGATSMLGTTPNANIAALATDANGALYVAIGSTVLVFKTPKGDPKPDRIISDETHLNYFGYAAGSMLLVR